MADVLAEAVVELEADVDKANKELKAALKQMDKDAKAAADDIDKSFKQLSGNLGKEFEQAAKEFARQQQEQEREAKRVAREIERENARVQREIEREARQTQRAIEVETARVARENIREQKQFEKEFIASQRAMENAATESQQRRVQEFRNHISTLRRIATEKFSLTLGVDTSQLKGALGAATKLGAVLGAVGVGTLAGKASLSGIAQLAVAIQDLVGNIALLPAVGASAGIVIGTLTLGLRGLGDAIAADKTKDLDEALKKLSENGKKFVLTVRDLKDEFEDLGKAVQQELLAGFNTEVEKLAKVLLPVLRKGFTGVARELNLGALSLAEFVRKGQTISDIERIFVNTQQSAFVFRRSLEPLAQAFRDLAAVGSDFLPVISAELGGAAKRFGDFIARARETGTLKFMFENAVQGARDLFAILGNLGGIFGAILDNSRLAFGNRGLLGFIREVTGSLNDFFNSIEGQVALLNFFDQVGRAAEVVVPIIRELARIVFSTLLPALVKLGEIAAPAVQALLNGLDRGLNQAIPGINSFVNALTSVIVALVDSGVLDALGELVKVLGTALGKAIRLITPTLGDLVNSVLVKLQEILPKILPALAKFANAFGDLVIAALPIVDILASFISEVGFPTLQRIAEKLVPIIEDLVKGLGEALLPILPDLADAIGEWVDAMAPLVDDVLRLLVDLLKILVPLLPSIVRSSTQIAKALKPVFDVVVSIIDPISKFIAKLYEIPGVKKFMEEQLPEILALLTGSLIIPLGKLIELIEKFVTMLDDAGVFDVFLAALGVLANALIITGDSFTRLRDTVEAVWNIIKAVVGGAIEFILTVISTGFEVIKAVFNAGWEFIKAIWNASWEFLKAIARGAIQFIIAIVTGNFNAIPGIVGDALRRMRDAASDAFNALLDLVRNLPQRILSALGSVGSLLYNAGQDLVRGFINGIGSMISALAGEAANMARSALSAAKNALVSRSPSRLMMVVGEDFGKGFIIGIDSMVKKASAAGAELASLTTEASTTALAPNDNSVFRMNETLNRLTRNGLGPVPTAGAPAGATAPETAPVVVQPEVRVYIGNEEINGHITEVVDDRDRRTKRSLTMGARRTV